MPIKLSIMLLSSALKNHLLRFSEIPIISQIMSLRPAFINSLIPTTCLHAKLVIIAVYLCVKDRDTLIEQSDITVTYSTTAILAIY